MSKRAVMIGLVLIGCAGWMWQQQRLIGELRAGQGRAEALESELEALKAENQRLALTAGESNELRRLRLQTPELMRLRGEAGVLRNELQEARRRAVTAAPRAALLETNAPPAPAVVAYTGSVSASIANGQTLVMGGWAVSPGRRILLFVTPQIEPSPQGPGQVTYRTKLVEVPETVMSTLGLDGLKTQDNTSSQHGFLTPGQADIAFSALQKADGAETLSAPSVTTLSGRQAQVAVLNRKTVAGSDEPVEVGPRIDLIPTISADGASVHTVIQARLNLESKPAPAP